MPKKDIENKETEEKIEEVKEPTEKNESSCNHGESSCNHECHCKNKDKKSKNDDKLKEQIETLETQNKELIEKVKVAQAELVNYRKRKDEETNSLLKYANQDLIMEIILVIDNFERAIKLDDNDLTDELSKFLDGFKMMYATLTDILKKYGVEEINRVGEVFDPNQEEALLTDNVEELDDDVVIEVLLKGYKLKGRVIRPASVKINQK